MFAPKLYTVYKLPLRDIVAADFRMNGGAEEMRKYKIRQQDSSMLRQIRLITGKDGQFNPYIVFVKIDKKDDEIIRRIVLDGFYIGDKHFVFSERSASMTRNGILSFVDSDIYDELDKRITMDITFDKIVLSSVNCSYMWRHI